MQVLTIWSIIEFQKILSDVLFLLMLTFCLCTYLEHTQRSQNLMPRDQPEEERINAKYVENGRQK